MKKILSLCLVLTVLLSCVGCGKTETTNNDSANTTESTTETTTESTTESTTETTTETTTEKKTETTTNKKVENTTKKPETTTKKPNKTETTTKKPVTTTKPSKSEEEENREMMYGKYGGKEGYEAHLKEVANYKCNRCGKHNCPSLEYGKDLLGNPDWPSIWPEKCPAIINETAKCPHCGKTLVADDRWLTEPNKYCDGACHLNFS